MLNEESIVKDKVLISIVTVCYNSANTIARTIESILKQTYTNYEYIIIDGVSQDNTIKIIQTYSDLFEGRMKFISEPDLGIYDAMNKGILQSNGDIIGIINSDDWLELDTLQAIYEKYIENNNKKGIYTGYINFYYNNINKQVLSTSSKRFTQKIVQNLMPIRHPATFVSSSIYNEVGLFDISYKINGDKDFIFRCYKSKIPFYFIDKVLSNMSDNGISNNINGFMKSLKDELLFIQKHNIKFPSSVLLILRFIFIGIIKFILPRKLIYFFRAK